MNDADFTFLEELLKKESGLSITRDKTYLLESRLLPIAAQFKLDKLGGLVQKMRAGGDTELRRCVIEAMTTNETSFFRDSTPFDRMKQDVLPFFIRDRAGQKRLRIWSAACSSGQEPYSLAILLKEYGPQLAGWNIEIVATDLSHDILAQAKSGRYTQFEVQRGMPIQLLVKYFTQDGDKWEAKPELKQMITFRPLNLLMPYTAMGTFDIIFCRNVLIYFDVADKKKVFQQMKGILAKDGVLFLGGAETVMGITQDFKTLPQVQGMYVRDDSSFAAAAA